MGASVKIDREGTGGLLVPRQPEYVSRSARLCQIVCSESSPEMAGSCEHQKRVRDRRGIASNLHTPGRSIFICTENGLLAQPSGWRGLVFAQAYLESALAELARSICVAMYGPASCMQFSFIPVLLHAVSVRQPL